MPRRPLSRLALLVALWLTALAASAAPSGQTHFSAVSVAGDQRFDYDWGDPEGSHHLAFALDAQAINAARRDFRAYARADLEAAAAAEIERQLQGALADLERAYPGVELHLGHGHSIAWRIAPDADLETRRHSLFGETLNRELAAIQSDYPGSRITQGTDGNYDLKARSRGDLIAIQDRLTAAQNLANEAAARLVAQSQAGVERRADRLDQDLKNEVTAVRQRLEDFKLAYFRERLYRLDEDGGLLPDYARIAARALPGLAPLGQALEDQVQGLPTRAALTRVLSFVQTIPYARLDDRATDPGFLPPLVMLADNRGDCDTKTVAVAAVAHLLFPQVPIALILVPRHAFLGLGLQPQPGDRFIEREGRTWLLAEPVGPASLPLGRIGAESAAMLEQVTAVIPLFP